MQRDAHLTVTVSAAEEHGDLASSLLESPGDGKAGHVLHERRAEPDDLRIERDQLIDDEITERVGGLTQLARGRQGDPPPGGVLTHRIGSVAVPVQRPGEDPVAQGVRKTLLGDGGVVVGTERAIAPVQQELREPQATVVCLGPADAVRGTCRSEDSKLQRRPGQVMPGHTDQTYPR
jgi:hypothetical protein